MGFLSTRHFSLQQANEFYDSKKDICLHAVLLKRISQRKLYTDKEMQIMAI